MKTVEELFGDEVMGYKAPVAKGVALGYPEQVGGVSDLLGFRADIGADSLEEQRYLQMGGGNVPGAPVKPVATQSRTANENTGLMLTAKQLNYKQEEKVVTVGNLGSINWTETPYGVPKTPQKGLGPGIGNAGMLPGEEKKAPGAPMKMRQPQFGGARRTKKTRKAKKSRTVRRTGRKTNVRNTFRISFQGQIRMKQRHRQ